MKFTTAKEVITHLYSLPKLHAKGDLTYVSRVLAALGNPQDKVKMVHVTGTNGKGSTSYYLSSLLQEAGQKTGLFVSPYVFEFNERIQINKQNIPDHDLVLWANRIEAVLAEIKQTDPNFGLITFEYEVVMAFCYFAVQKCDYAVIEVGIGGTHDTTNVITPEVSVITTVGLDHEKLIGPTIQDIAREKAGIIKTKRPVVCGNVPENVLPIIKKQAAAMAAPIFVLGHDFTITSHEVSLYQDKMQNLKFIRRPEVETYDIAVAVKAFSLLNVQLTAEKIMQAINHTQIPGRYQILQTKPLVVADGAHNVQAMKNILKYTHQQAQRSGGQVRILLAMMKDKDIDQVFSLFAPSDQVTLTTLNYERAAKKADFDAQGGAAYAYQPNADQALNDLLEISKPQDVLLITGSFYLVSEILLLRR